MIKNDSVPEFTYLCLKISRILNLSNLITNLSTDLVNNLIHKFSVAFLTKPYNCRLSSSIFLLSFFH